MGCATIQDGKYDTRSVSTFKGCISGPSRVLIVGGDGKFKNEEHPYGNELFAPYSQEVEIPKDGGEVNLTIAN